MASLNSGSAGSYNYGPGGVSGRPLNTKAIRIRNNTGATLFLPENSQAEMTAMYNNFPGKAGITIYKGAYIYNGLVFNPTVNYNASGPCWSPPGAAPASPDPAACPGGWTDTGIVSAVGNPNDYSGNGSVLHDNALWMCYQMWGWGCPAGYGMGCAARGCYAP